MCLIYNDAEDRAATIGRFLAGGLARDGAVGYFGELERQGPIVRRIDDAGIDLAAASRAGRFLCRPARETYAPDGSFDVNRMLGTLHDGYCACRAKVPGPVRFSGEMEWALDDGISGAGDLARYELAVNGIIRSHPFSAICQYNAALFDSTALYVIMKAHPYVVTQGQVIANPLYSPDARLPTLDRLAA